MNGLVTKIARRLRINILRELDESDWNQFVSVLSNASVSDQRQILNAYKNRRIRDVGAGVTALIDKAIETRSVNRAQAILADNQISEDELKEILNGE